MTGRVSSMPRRNSERGEGSCGVFILGKTVVGRLWPSEKQGLRRFRRPVCKLQAKIPKLKQVVFQRHAVVETALCKYFSRYVVGMDEIVGMLRVVSVIESAGAFVDAELLWGGVSFVIVGNTKKKGEILIKTEK